MIQQRWGVWSAAAVCVAAFFSIGATPSDAGVVWYINDYEGWTAAAGDVFEINFNTLPDGSPSVAGMPITPDFNYTAQGVTFSGPVNFPFIVGNTTVGFDLEVDSSPSIQRNWIIGEEETPTHALGIRYPSFAILSIYDDLGRLIDSESYLQPGVPFLGVISDVPVASFTVDRHDSFAVLGTYYRGTIPEPSVLILFGVCVLVLRVRKARRQTIFRGVKS